MTDEQVGERLASCVDKLFPSATAGILRKPASRQAVDRLEDLTGLEVPIAVKKLYMRFDGQEIPSNRPASLTDVCPLIYPFFYWCSLDAMMERWSELNAIDWDPQVNVGEDGEDSRIRDFQFHKGWLPVGFSGAANVAFIDLYPGSDGRYGQIIESDFVAPPRLLGYSLSSCFEHLLCTIHSGLIVPGQREWRYRDGAPCISPPKLV